MRANGTRDAASFFGDVSRQDFAVDRQLTAGMSDRLGKLNSLAREGCP
jgi:hypothetical protein